MSVQVNKLSTRREGGVKKSQIFVNVECERPLSSVTFFLPFLYYRGILRVGSMATILPTLFLGKSDCSHGFLRNVWYSNPWG